MTDLPLRKKVTMSSIAHSARRRGCTLVVNLNPACSFINTTPAGTEALIGEMILHIPAACLLSQLANNKKSTAMRDKGAAKMWTNQIVQKRKKDFTKFYMNVINSWTYI